MPVAKRLAILQAHIDRWQTLDWKEQHFSIPHGHLYEFTAGVYCIGNVDALTVVSLPSIVRGTESSRWTLSDFGFPLIDFSFDPYQDLLVMAELRADGANETYPVIHFRSLSTGLKHPKASVESVHCNKHGRSGTFIIRVNGPLVGVMYRSTFDLDDPTYYQTIDWKKGAHTISAELAWAPTSFCWLNQDQILLPYRDLRANTPSVVVCRVVLDDPTTATTSTPPSSEGFHLPVMEGLEWRTGFLLPPYTPRTIWRINHSQIGVHSDPAPMYNAEAFEPLQAEEPAETKLPESAEEKDDSPAVAEGSSSQSSSQSSSIASESTVSDAEPLSSQTSTSSQADAQGEGSSSSSWTDTPSSSSPPTERALPHTLPPKPFAIGPERMVKIEWLVPEVTQPSSCIEIYVSAKVLVEFSDEAIEKLRSEHKDAKGKSKVVVNGHESLRATNRTPTGGVYGRDAEEIEVENVVQTGVEPIPPRMLSAAELWEHVNHHWASSSAPSSSSQLPHHLLGHNMSQGQGPSATGTETETQTEEFLEFHADHLDAADAEVQDQGAFDLDEDDDEDEDEGNEDEDDFEGDFEGDAYGDWEVSQEDVLDFDMDFAAWMNTVPEEAYANADFHDLSPPPQSAPALDHPPNASIYPGDPVMPGLEPFTNTDPGQLNPTDDEINTLPFPHLESLSDSEQDIIDEIADLEFNNHTILGTPETFRRSSREEPTPKYHIPWDAWGPSQSRMWWKQGPDNDFQCFMYGTRVVSLRHVSKKLEIGESPNDRVAVRVTKAHVLDFARGLGQWKQHGQRITNGDRFGSAFGAQQNFLSAGSSSSSDASTLTTSIHDNTTIFNGSSGGETPPLLPSPSALTSGAPVTQSQYFSSEPNHASIVTIREPDWSNLYASAIGINPQHPTLADTSEDIDAIDLDESDEEDEDDLSPWDLAQGVTGEQISSLATTVRARGRAWIRARERAKARQRNKENRSVEYETRLPYSWASRSVGYHHAGLFPNGVMIDDEHILLVETNHITGSDTIVVYTM